MKSENDDKTDKSKEKKGATEKNVKGIKPIKGGIIALIIVDYILFYFSFFDTFWNWIDENKGIPFTLFLFVTSWIIYLRMPKIED